jgi:hypothetical protein
MVNFKMIAVATIAGWVAVMAGQIADLFPDDPPTVEMMP